MDEVAPVILDTEKFRAELRGIITEALQEEFGRLYIGREDHFKQHLFVAEVMEYCKSCKSAVAKTILVFIVTGLLSLMCVGFILKYNGD